MKRLIIFGLIGMGLMFGSRLFAQSSFTITGTVGDSTGSPLVGASAVMLQAKDSVIKSFAFSDANGAIVFKRVQAGEYILQVSYLGYEAYSKPLSLKAGTGDQDLGKINLKAKTKTLDEVVIEGERTPVEIKGDTVQYNADAYVVQPNAVVEDLLKRLPGVEVEDDGTVKAQGEDVKRVLVDGKEFFGDDPQVATKNLPADAVENIQVFDKMSDMAEFSGVDDGEREKTINVTLKKDRKKGYFGNVTGGYGTKDRYEAKASINRFNNNLQLSFIGMSNNINQQGFTFDEYIGFSGGGGGRGGRGGGGSRFGGSGNSAGVPISRGLGNGFINTSAGGLNLTYNLGKKTELTTSYFVNRVDRDIDKTITRENFIGESSFFYDDTTSQDNINTRHNLNLRLEHNIDSMSQLIVRVTGSMNQGDNSSFTETQTLDIEGRTENASERLNTSVGDRINVNSNATYRRKFKKKGRFLSVSLSGGVLDNDQQNTLYSVNSFFPKGGVFRSDTLNQEQPSTNNQLSYRARLSYTEPIGKRKYLEFNYNRQNFQNEVNQEVFDLIGADDPERVLNRRLSNHYEREYTYDQVGLNFRMAEKKVNFSTGLSVQHSQLFGDIISNGTIIDQEFTNFLPNMQLNLTFAPTKRLRMDYRTNVNEPSLEQLQPIVDNTDPLNVYIGNPNLRPEYTHRMNLRYISFDRFSFITFFAFINASYTENKIVNAVTIDSLFRRRSMPVNIDKDYRIMGFVNYGMPIRPLKIKFNLSGNVIYNRSFVPINSILNTTDRITSSANFRIENRKKDVVDIMVGTRLSHNLTIFSEDDQQDQEYLTQTLYTDLSLNIANNWRFNTRFDYSMYSGEAFGDLDPIPIWRASLSRYFLKNKRGELKITAFDILNKNLGINRTAELNYIEEERIQSLSRFFLVSFIYNLSKLGANSSRSSGGQGGFRMRRG